MVATLARFGGAKAPADRPMDSLDQSDFLLGRSEKSAEGFPIFCAVPMGTPDPYTPPK
jgi:arylsulfatase